MKLNLNMVWCTLLFTLFVLGAAQPASAYIYQYAPGVQDVYDLDHYKYYTWGVNWTPQNQFERITSAELSIKNINNWTVEDNDRLFVELLDYAQLGLKTFDDNQGGGNNFANWSGNHLLLDEYTDLHDFPGPAENYKYKFTTQELESLNQWITDGRIGFGFDPDCHYWNDGVKFKITTATPEPATIALFASGLLGGFGLRRKKKIA